MRQPEFAQHVEHPSITTRDFLDNPAELRHTLEAAGALQFTPYKSGLFPASDLLPETGEATGMNMAWFRDNAHVGNALLETGQTEQAAAVGNAMLTVLASNRDILDDVVSRRAPERRLAVRVHGDTLRNDTEPRVQNDSSGYALWLTSKLIRHGVVEPNDERLDTLAQTARYLETVRFWEAEDEGHWEEDRRVHASSIGVVVAGLREAQSMFGEWDYAHDINFGQLQRKGTIALEGILAQGLSDLSPRRGDAEPTAAYPSKIDPNINTWRHFRSFDVERREHDAALLFLVEPLGVLTPYWRRRIINNVATHLQRPHGTARYQGDTYWGPRFPDIMSIEERTQLIEGSTDRRNQTAAGVAYSGTEAQWTMFDPIPATYWGKQYQEAGAPRDRKNQLDYLDRSLEQLVITESGAWHLPEAYYYDTVDTGKTARSQWVPNPHTPLLWAQANLLLALKTFEESYAGHR